MADFLYLPPHKQVTLYGGVSATVDTDYLDDWLCDGRPARPARGTSGAFSATFSFTAGTVNLVAVSHHNITAAITVGGGLSGTIAASATQQNGIPLNVFTTVTPASVSGFTLSASNAVTWVVGEVFAGEAISLTLPKLSSDDRGLASYTRKVDVDMASIPPYDDGRDGMAPWKGTFVLTTAELTNVIDWYRAQRNGTRPSLIVPTTSVNEAIVGFLQPPQYSPIGPALWRVQLMFDETPRMRWPA